MQVAAAGAGGLGALATMAGPVVERAYAADPCGTGSLDDIEHFVLLMMENRSFDHYYGTMSGVRGFADAAKAGTLRQYSDPSKSPKDDFYYAPFRLNTVNGATLTSAGMPDGECVNDPTHDWAPQHQAWNGGRMDQWVKVHLASEGQGNGPATMGYYEREDIPVHRALAEAFTLCDRYHCSVLGPTDPNRLYWVSAWLDPEGKQGGPLLNTPETVPIGKYSWRTFPENLEDAGVSWKFYNDQSAPVAAEAILSGMVQAFTQYTTKVTNTNLPLKGLGYGYQTDFRADVLADTLPQVSWVIPPLLNCEHPALPPSFGAATLIEVLDILTSNPKVWEKTALIISYDENGGFYDHVPPPTSKRGTPGEWITAQLDQDTKDIEAGISGPIGLGFRVPGLVISPYSRGGLVASEVFDHTSQLKLIAKRFGVEVPNISEWRDKTVGDMTSAFDFGTKADAGKPKLAATQELDMAHTLLECKASIDGFAGTFAGKNNFIDVYPATRNNVGPTQATTPKRRAPSGPVDECGDTKAAADDTGTTTKIPVTKRKSTKRTRIGAAGDTLAAQQLADTGPDTSRTALAGAALLAAGAVTAAAAPQVARAITRDTGGDEAD